MRARSSFNLLVVSPPNPSTSNPKHRNRKRSKQPFIIEESPVDTMVDQRTMAELLRTPTEGYAEAIVVPPILAEQFELKHSLINMMTSNQFFGLEKDNSQDHICWFNKITSTIKYKDVPNSAINLMLFPFSLAGAACRTTNLRNEISNSQQRFDESFHEAWDRYKDLIRACPHYGFTELHQLDTFYNALNLADHDSFNSAAGGNPLERRTQDVLTIIENKSKCLAAGGNTFSELRDNIQGYVAAAAVNYNQGNSVYRPPAVPLNKLEKVKRINEANMKAMQTQINNVKNELGNEMKNSVQASMSNQTNEIKNMMASLFQMNTASTSESGSLPRNTIANPKEDERVEETLTDQDLAEYTIKKMLKALLSNKEKLKELANIPFNENCLAVILKKLPEKHRDPGKFLILCGFSELKYKAIADLGASINLMPLSVWKKLGLPELISTRLTFELANRAICTPAEIARDVFILVGKFTFPADFVIFDYESDPRVLLILGRPFLRTARALIDVHDEEMILCDGDERLTLNIRHDTSSYSNQPQKESINLINVFNDSSEDFLEDLFSTNQPSGNPTFSSHHELTSLEVKDDIFDPEGGNVLPEKLLDLNSTKDLHPPLHVNPLSGSTTYSSSPTYFLEEFADELTLITFPPEYDDDLQFDIESDLKEIEYLLYHDSIKDIDSSLKDLMDQSNLADLNNNLVDSVPERFTDEHTLDYSSPPLFDEYDDNLFKVESDTENVYNDPFDSKGEKIKESKLLIGELDLPCDFLSSFEYDSFLFEDFSRVDVVPSTNNEDKVFNLALSLDFA
nr:reverse transcriptase domain-containing protein [Tanacetum cinerariifolium]